MSVICMFYIRAVLISAVWLVVQLIIFSFTTPVGVPLSFAFATWQPCQADYTGSLLTVLSV